MPQSDWRWCYNCQLLWYAGPGNFSGGYCPARNPNSLGQHLANTQSTNYILLFANEPGSRAQPNWRHCRYCSGLFYAGNPTTGCCGAEPSRGITSGHDYTGSGEYGVDTLHSSNRQSGWRWCRKCQGLFFFGNQTSGVCAAGGGHDAEGSAEYSV
jgi:hypothetical protein